MRVGLKVVKGFVIGIDMHYMGKYFISVGPELKIVRNQK